jgi:hypothetical protein
MMFDKQRIPLPILQCMIQFYENTYPSLFHRISVSSFVKHDEMEQIAFRSRSKLVWISIPESCSSCRSNGIPYCCYGMRRLFVDYPYCANGGCVGCIFDEPTEQDDGMNEHIQSHLPFMVYSHGYFGTASGLLPLVQLMDASDLVQVRCMVKLYGAKVLEYAQLRLALEFYAHPNISTWKNEEWYGHMLASNTFYYEIPPLCQQQPKVILDWFEGYAAPHCECVMPANFRLVNRIRIPSNWLLDLAYRRIQWRDSLLDFPKTLYLITLFLKKEESIHRVWWDYFDALLPCHNAEALYCEHHSDLKYRVDRSLDYANSPVLCTGLPSQVADAVFSRFNRTADRLLQEFEVLYDQFRQLEAAGEKTIHNIWDRHSIDMDGKYILDVYLD